MGKSFRAWASGHQFQIVVFNLLLVLLVLLRSAGYFSPFLPITINMIFVAGFVLAIFLLDAKSSAFLSTAIIFWLIAGFFRLAGIDIWAERAAIYTFEALVVGVLLFIVGTLREKK